jgi:rod shape-determining protein MreC
VSSGWLKDDVFSHRGVNRPRSGRPGVQHYALMFIALCLLVLSRLQHGLIVNIQTEAEQMLAPVLSTAMVPLQPFRRLGREVTQLFALTQEVERLREENQQLKGYEWRAKELERRIVRLEDIAKVVPDRGVSFITARVVAQGSGPFVRSALLNAGRTQGLRNGYPVVNANGLAGRIVAVGQDAARALLITDINSRIPVLIGDGQVRAIAIGDNGPQLRLGYLPPDARISSDQEVYTSGVGGVFPRGLRLGRTVVSGDSVRVRPYVALDEIEYVAILFHDTPTLDGASDAAVARPRVELKETRDAPWRR